MPERRAFRQKHSLPSRGRSCGDGDAFQPDTLSSHHLCAGFLVTFLQLRFFFFLLSKTHIYPDISLVHFISSFWFRMESERRVRNEMCKTNVMNWSWSKKKKEKSSTDMKGRKLDERTRLLMMARLDGTKLSDAASNVVVPRATSLIRSLNTLGTHSPLKWMQVSP